ncbi:hypothetical protein RCIA110 [Methanocella arvoryzae MRE50]|uniref:Uncharacterized protein n=1 Tax=Methanocella arvoryzae (strain DSM 22066 / NBRC 105507 / MRE50) TaxID=351160 RepID=Q0W4H3_METAR|nr:hypothetical protein RCIA110 [Methanocella arvoryzae MRE50]
MNKWQFIVSELVKPPGTPRSQVRQVLFFMIGVVPIERVPGVPGFLAFHEKLALGVPGPLAGLAVFSTHTGPTFNFSCDYKS